METFLNQLSAILGVVVGSLGTFLIARFTDREQWRRDQQIRWDERRIDAYASYAAIIKEIHILTFRVSAAARSSSHSLPIDREQGLELLAEANARRTQAWEVVLLLGDEEVVAAAREWQEAVWVEERLCSGDSIDKKEWQLAVAAVDGARDKFYFAARGNLNISGGSVAQSSFLRAKVKPTRTEDSSE